MNADFASGGFVKSGATAVVGAAGHETKLVAFFRHWDRVEKLQLAADRWVGTPFVPFAAICGAGVDCVHLNRELLQESGFNVPGGWPRYAIDGGKHNRESQLIAWLETQICFQRVIFSGEYDATCSMPGDTLCLIRGRSAHHAGTLISGSRFVHANFVTRSVTISTLNDPSFKRRLTAVYRPMEAG